MNTPPVWLLRDTVLAMHEAQIAEHGGKAGLRDGHALDIALARPQEFFTHNGASLPDLAACYAGSIMRKLPFQDGNKRVAFVAALTFLRLNGLRFTGSMGESVTLMLRLAKGRACENDLAQFLQSNVAPLAAEHRKKKAHGQG